LIHDGKSEKLIPVIPEVVMGMDLDEGLIVIMPMDGLLD
jgi:ribosomal 30S subunit maturation factor RimM